MDITSILYPVLCVGGLGVVLGAGLGYAGKIFEVKEDPRLEQVLECLPGANCGGCGYPGCSGMASAIVSGKAPVNGCPVGGAKSAAAIAKVMGVAVEETAPKVAFVKCHGTCDKSVNKYVYEGISDCAMANQLAGGGAKGCSFGCLGLGSCVKACAFDAIHIVDGVAKVDETKCTSCGNCVKACPKHLIEIVPQAQQTRVACSSQDTGKEVMANCQVGCIACRICEKNCKFDAIYVINNVAVIDYTKCKDCGLCAMKCPKHAIENPKAIAMAEKLAQNAAAKVEAAKKPAPVAEAPATEAPATEAPASSTSSEHIND
ncbi:MAG TPA: RnfABCDGE type electron transport complex subunit B [Firmicutes bacterium]|nr:RnfABCDGE type electron transport complex subunit B [Bacillota bacterium]